MPHSDPPSSDRPPTETELKFALPLRDPDALAAMLARVPTLRRRRAVTVTLHNVYYDTAEQLLRQNMTALRLRQLGDKAHPRWVQTLKIGASDASALSQRGEWETELAAGELLHAALMATPWQEFDPDARIFASLKPCFSTIFDRTSWVVRKRDGSALEVCLDIGHVQADGKEGPVSEAICELEIELLQGSAEDLFDIAEEISRTLCLIPLGMSKAERGYRAAQGTLHAPRYAQPPSITADMAPVQVVKSLLREMFQQFTANLVAMRTSDAPELVHQARVAWRRFRSLVKLFKNQAVLAGLPAREPLAPLLDVLRVMRDTDVAMTETLPPFANAYVAGSLERQQHWREMERMLAQSAADQRLAVRNALDSPALGLALVQIARWLELPAAATHADSTTSTNTTDWIRLRMERLNKQLKAIPKDSDDPDALHAARIVSKQLRYCTEALAPLLPKRRARHWRKKATAMQTDIGTLRDFAQALNMLAHMPVAPGLLEFLRGLHAGIRAHSRH